MAACALVFDEDGAVRGVVAGEFGLEQATASPGPSYEPGMELRGKYVLHRRGGARLAREAG